MITESPDKSREELKEMQRRKRRVYLIVLFCGFLIFALNWTAQEPGDVFIRYLYPVFALMLLGLFGLMAARSIPVRKLEYLTLITISLIVMGHLAWHFHFAGSLDEHLLPLVGGHYWAVGALIVGAFVMFDRKGGLITGVIIMLLSIILAVTGTAGAILRGEASRNATLYLIRVHLFLILLLGLTSAVTSMRDKLVHALTRAEILGQWATTDILTGLANRRAAEEFLKRQTAARSRYGRPLSIIMADLDHFKRINDTHGHDAGDAALMDISRIILKSVRDPDFVARWGGEEFLIIAPHTDINGVGNLAERIRAAVEGAAITNSHPLTVSLGAVEMRAGESEEQLIKRADRAMYVAKQQGRNRVVAE